MLRPVFLLFGAVLSFGYAAEQPSIEEALKLAAAGKLDQAAVLFETLEKADPRNPEIEYRFGLVLLKQDKLEGARRRLESAAKLDPKNAFVWRALALFHDSLGKTLAARDPIAAAKEYQQAVSLDPTRAPYYVDLARLFLDHNTAEPAEIVLQDAAGRFPNNTEVLRLLGLAYYAEGKSQQALDAFLKAVEADPDLESAYASLETLLPYAESRLAEITAKLRRFSERRPSSPVGPYLLALISPENSEALLRHAIQRAPDFWPAYYELHKLLKAQGKWDEAAAAIRKTIELDPDFAPAHYALAEIHNRNGDRVHAAQERELHHKLVTAQRAAAEKQRQESPRLSYTLSER